MISDAQYTALHFPLIVTKLIRHWRNLKDDKKSIQECVNNVLIYSGVK